MSDQSLTGGPAFRRIAPFAAYMGFIVAFDLLKPLMPAGPMADNFTALVYPVKILAVTLLLAFYWKSYDELSFKSIKIDHILGAVIIGAVVFILWINMDWGFATLGETEPYDPNMLPGKLMYAFFAVRLLGAAVIVPVFEEIFWRSFVLRYIVNHDFLSVRLGTFTWMSFVVSSLLFGSEHHLWLAGIMAGVFYNLLLYWSRSLYVCIISHGVTNLLLGLYVIKTGNWQFW